MNGTNPVREKALWKPRCGIQQGQLSFEDCVVLAIEFPFILESVGIIFMQQVAISALIKMTVQNRMCQGVTKMVSFK